MDANVTAETGGLRDRRLAVGLSQEALARRADCSLSMVRVAERGFKTPPSPAVARMLAILENESSQGANPGSIGDDHQGAGIARHDLAA